jgi:hypothetical protein
MPSKVSQECMAPYGPVSSYGVTHWSFGKKQFVNDAH